MNAFSIVDEFEQRVADFAGASHAVATNTGTSAIFLSLQYQNLTSAYRGPIHLPARTFISVPMACLQCGFVVEFSDYSWSGVYPLTPFGIWDGALRFRKGMYKNGLHCLSFQARKLLNIGEGGMILTDDREAAKWLRKARYSGREAPAYAVEDVDMVGWQAYMTPEKATRGLQLMEYVAHDLPDQVMKYPDLRNVKLFKEEKCSTKAPNTDYRNLQSFTHSQTSRDTFRPEKTAALMRSSRSPAGSS